MSESGEARSLPPFSHFEAVGIPQFDQDRRDEARLLAARKGRSYPVVGGDLEGRQWVDWRSGTMLNAFYGPDVAACWTPQYADGQRLAAQITGIINDNNCLGCMVTTLDLYDAQLNDVATLAMSPAGVSWRWEHLDAAYRMGHILTVRLTFMLETVVERSASLDELDDQSDDLHPIGLYPDEYWTNRGLSPGQWAPPTTRLVVVVDEVEQRSTEALGMSWWHMRVHGARTDRPWVMVAEPRVLPEVEPGEALVVAAWACGTLSLTRTEARAFGYAY